MEDRVDNKRVKTDRQAGIKRVMQRKGDLKPGQGGKMSAGGSEKNWKRGDSLTPRRA